MQKHQTTCKCATKQNATLLGMQPAPGLNDLLNGFIYWTL